MVIVIVIGGVVVGESEVVGLKVGFWWSGR